MLDKPGSKYPHSAGDNVVKVVVVGVSLSEIMIYLNTNHLLHLYSSPLKVSLLLFVRSVLSLNHLLVENKSMYVLRNQSTWLNN